MSLVVPHWDPGAKVDPFKGSKLERRGYRAGRFRANHNLKKAEFVDRVTPFAVWNDLGSRRPTRKKKESYD